MQSEEVIKDRIKVLKEEMQKAYSAYDEENDTNFLADANEAGWRLDTLKWVLSGD